MNYIKNIKYLLFIVSLSINVVVCVAQNDFDLTQKWFNETLYNPASAGNNFSTGVFLHTQQLWGFPGAPSTHAGTVDTYIEDLRSGVGLTFAVDKYGSISSYNFRLAYAFYIPIGEKAVLSLGLSGGILARNRRVTGSGIEDPDDSSWAYGNVSEYSPDFDFGFEFKGPFKLGASIRHLGVQPPKYNLPKHSINIWAYLSSRFNVSESLSLEPMIATLNNELSYYAEAGALLYFLKTERRNTYSDRFWMGALYRTNGSFAALAGVNLTPKIRLGYSFDYVIGDFSSIAKGGRHELFFSFYFNRIFYKDETCPAYRNYKRK
ncbi:MAG: PorP/SprF family type IX secretion system membrane protein [Prevotellaceae bacterium]|nr:PorP/SprF family type IX secretion system membrane protein [Prevotellaceae bacterium]